MRANQPHRLKVLGVRAIFGENCSKTVDGMKIALVELF
jgi:hypothetical protein